MTAWLSAPLVHLAWCWRLARGDGVVVGMTTHDAPLRFGGLTYRPEPGIKPSAIRQRRGWAGDSLDVEGALASAAVAAGDLVAGRWSGAAATLFLTDWSDADAAPLRLLDAVVGAVTTEGASFTAELDADRAALDAPAVPLTASGCRAELGDALCRVDLAPRTHRLSVAAVDGLAVTLGGAVPDGLAHGRLTVLSGRARGLGARVVAQEGALLWLSGALSGLGAGDAVRVSEGCDRTAATCSTRFANIANFRGEPHLPGIDLLTRFPGA